MTAMGIAPGIVDTAACGMTSVGAAADVELEFDLADCEIFTFGADEIEEFKFGELEIEVLEFGELQTEELAITDRLEMKLDSLASKAFVFNISAE
jgi:hypothetical protein